MRKNLAIMQLNDKKLNAIYSINCHWQVYVHFTVVAFVFALLLCKHRMLLLLMTSR